MNRFETNTEKQTALNASFKDGLALINADSNVQNGACASEAVSRNTLEESWVSCLGILTFDETGKQLLAYGNVQSCQSFIEQNAEIDFSKNSISVELFQGDLIIISSLNDSYRLISVDPSSAKEMFHDVFPDIELSNAEIRVLMQLLSGLTLKEAAKNDNVSYETKRSQFKSLSLRTGFNSQGEVIRNALLVLNAHILQGISENQINRNDSDGIEQIFLDQFYKSIFRLHKIFTPTGRINRVLEAGPVTGTPVVFVHSQTLPPPSQINTAWLIKKNIRLFIPLREGMLEENGKMTSSKEHVKNATDDLINTIEVFCGGKAKVVAQSSGVAYCVNLAKIRPELISQMTLSAPAYLGKYENSLVDSLVKSFFNIASQNNFILEQIYAKYLKKMSTKSGLHNILYSAYKKSPKDMELLESILSTSQGYRWLRKSYELSKYSVINDVLLGSQDVWKDVENVKTEVLFVHGKKDPINSAAHAKTIQKRFPNSKFVLLVEDGQSLFLNRFSDIISNNQGEWHLLRINNAE